VRKIICRAVVFSILAAMPLTAFASVSQLFKTDGTKNEVKFVNREVFMRQTNGVWAPLLAPNNPNTGIQPGDVLVSLFSATTLSYGQTLVNSGWLPGDANAFLLGYSAQEVMNVSVANVGPTNFIAIDLGNVKADPFGVLNPGDQVAVYNSTTQWLVNNGGMSLANLQSSVTQSLQNAILWEKFNDADGYPGALDFAQSSGLIIDPINKVFVSAQYGLSSQGNSAFAFAPKDWLQVGTLDDIAGRANADLNDDYVKGLSPWMYDSQDPLTFAAVPEPGTLALWGGCLAIGAVIALRRRQK
jgi:hypothetical protein